MVWYAIKRIKPLILARERQATAVTPTELRDRLVRLIYPSRCVICHRLLPADASEDSICPHCIQGMPRVAPGKFRVLRNSVALCWSPLYYRNEVEASIRRFKFYGRAHYHKVYGILLRTYMEELALPLPDVVTWAPLSRKRLRRRGYDQARLLAEEVALFFGQTALPLLRKVRHTRPQSSLSAQQRWRNAKDAYACMEGLDLTGKRVLLVDDIVTTGATLDHCALELIKAGAAEIACLTLARASSEQKN